jgi:hypothetical protein
MVSAVALATPAAGVYDGRSPHGDRQLDIALQVLRGGGSANWRIDVQGPCSDGSTTLSRTVATDVQPPEPKLRIRSGRFALSRSVTIETNGLRFHFALAGREVKGGFAGTFHYVETEYGITCDSTLLHWAARKTSRSFP